MSSQKAAVAGKQTQSRGISQHATSHRSDCCLNVARTCIVSSIDVPLTFFKESRGCGQLPGVGFESLRPPACEVPRHCNVLVLLLQIGLCDMLLQSIAIVMGPLLQNRLARRIESAEYVFWIVASVAVPTGSAPAVAEPAATQVSGFLACSVLLLELAILEALSRLGLRSAAAEIMELARGGAAQTGTSRPFFWPLRCSYAFCPLWDSL